jgi:hypothetical protein
MYDFSKRILGSNRWRKTRKEKERKNNICKIKIKIHRFGSRNRILQREKEVLYVFYLPVSGRRKTSSSLIFIVAESDKHSTRSQGAVEMKTVWNDSVKSDFDVFRQTYQT